MALKEMAEMSREEAIEILSRKTTIPNDGETFDHISMAFDKAIYALEQPEIVRCKEYNFAEQNGTMQYCTMWSMNRSDDFFCAFAERK